MSVAPKLRKTPLETLINVAIHNEGVYNTDDIESIPSTPRSGDSIIDYDNSQHYMEDSGRLDESHFETGWDVFEKATTATNRTEGITDLYQGNKLKAVGIRTY